MKTSRIAYICADPGVPVFGLKGCSIHVQEVVRALRRRGAQVSLFAARFDGAPPADLRDLPTHALPCPRADALATREQLCQQANRNLRRLLHRAGPFDLVYERYSLWSISGMRYARATDIPGLLEVNAPLIEEQAAHRGLENRSAAERMARIAFADATALIAVSKEVAGYVGAHGAPAHTVQVIPNGVNPRRFPVGQPATWSWKGKEATFTVGFVGTLKPWHGVPVLIEAFALLHSHLPHARLLLVGDGPERGQLELRVKQLGLESVTHFTGAVAADQIPGFLMAMDVAVAPYPNLDNFYFSPLKAYEYMAAGRATVASRSGQLNDLIQHGINGLLCEPGNVTDLERQLARLHHEVELRTRLAAAGRQTILDGLTWDHVAGRILEIAGNSRKAATPMSSSIQKLPAARGRGSRRNSRYEIIHLR